MARFNDLPAELRNIMYGELFSSESQSRHRTRNELAILTVSKQLHIEGSSYFYQNSEFTIIAPSPASDAATIFPPIADRYLRYLRRLTIYTSTGQADLPRTRRVAGALANFTIIGANFNELNISISSPLSHLLNSRVDDSTIDINHPIAVALLKVLKSGVAKILRIELENACFGLGVTHALQTASRTQVQLLVNNVPSTDLTLLERPLTGRYSSTHLTCLGLGEEHIADIYSDDAASVVSTPSLLPSSLCSAFTDLDTFSVASFELRSDPAEAPGTDFAESTTPEASMTEQAFFTEDDIEEWSASTQEDSTGTKPEMLGEMDDADGDDDMEDIQQDDIQVIMHNMEEATHHFANSDDVTYMTNFAPNLLLSRHHLSHLV